MAAFESAIANAARALSSRSLSSLQPSLLSLPPSSLLSSSRFTIFTATHRLQTDWKTNAYRRVSNLAEGDIEDSGGCTVNKKLKHPKSLFQRYRMRRGLAVTDVTASEWCEKGKEFALTLGKPELTVAMKNGRSRHLELEEEVLKRVEIRTESHEDAWAMKLLKFCYGTNQLLYKGFTRELPVVGLVEGVWMVGVIDEVRMNVTEAGGCPSLVDTKTRCQNTLPSEAQKEMQVSNDFPTSFFFKFFGLRPQHIFSQEVREHIANSGLLVVTLEELVKHFRAMCHLLPQSHDELLLRYEHQADCSILGEYAFTFDSGWFKSQIECCLALWLGKREAKYVSEDERWKCRPCSFSTTCPLIQMRHDTKTTCSD